MAAQISRAFGISVSSYFVKLVPSVVVEVSTMGDSPVTGAFRAWRRQLGIDGSVVPITT
jgi:hypothetical protein